MNKLIEDMEGLKVGLKYLGNAGQIIGIDSCIALVKKHMGHPCEPCPEKEKCQPELRDKPCALFPEKGKSCENCDHRKIDQANSYIHIACLTCDYTENLRNWTPMVKPKLNPCPCEPACKCVMDEPCLGCETYAKWLKKPNENEIPDANKAQGWVTNIIFAKEMLDLKSAFNARIHKFMIDRDNINKRLDTLERADGFRMREMNNRLTALEER